MEQGKKFNLSVSIPTGDITTIADSLSDKFDFEEVAPERKMKTYVID